MKKTAAQSIHLVSFQDFKKRAKTLLLQSKEESDKDMARFQASNEKKRQARKKKR